MKKGAAYVIGHILSAIIIACICACVGGTAIALTLKFLNWIF